MPKQKNVANITNREMDILNILWSKGEPMIASAITAADETLTINTVQATLRKLQEKKLIEIEDIVYSGTVLCRRYQPTMTVTEFSADMFSKYFKKLNKDISTIGMVSTLLEKEKHDEELLDELQKMIDQWKRDL